MSDRGLATRFLASAAEQSCTIHEPVGAGEAAAFVAARAAAIGGLVALGSTEPALPTDSVHDALAAASITPLTTAAGDWRDRIPDATVGVTGACVAVANLGIFAVAAGPGCPRAVSLLPETHVCIVAESAVVETLADGLARVAAAGPLPSALLWIGGPSRTGDLEMITTLGVHGPRAVELVIVAGT